MSSYIEKNVPVIKYENVNEDSNKEIISIIKLIKTNINTTKNHDKKNNNNNDNDKIKSYLEIFMEKYRYFDNHDEESFISKIKDGSINVDAIKNIINSKPCANPMTYFDIETYYNHPNKKKYSDETIKTFIEITIENYGLDDDYKFNASINNLSDAIEYLMFVVNELDKTKIKRDLLIKLLNYNLFSKYYSDLLKYYSYQLKIIDTDFNKNIKDKFVQCIKCLYFDRSDGYNTNPLDLTKETIISNLDLYTEMSNRRKQVNLICMFEEEKEPNIKNRNNPKMLKELLMVGEIFHKLKYNVYIVGAIQEINSETNTLHWRIIPHKFVLDYHDIVSKYSTNTTWIYLDVDFVAQ